MIKFGSTTLTFILLASYLTLNQGYSPQFSRKSRLFSTSSSGEMPIHQSFDEIVNERYACKRFKRFDNNRERTSEASPPDPRILDKIKECVNLARRAPTSFNTQPYKIVLVHSKEQKEALARHCMALNAQRVLDSDCTAVFLADKQICRTFPKYRREMTKHIQKRWPLFKIQFYITLFSSGYPLPRFVSAPISFCVRSVVGFLHFFSNFLFRFPLPSLGNAETWASRQTMIVAMTYMLACTSRKLATIPMEGFNAGGVRRVVGASGRRYAVPILVASGTAYEEKDKKTFTARYNEEDVIFSDKLGKAFGGGTA